MIRKGLQYIAIASCAMAIAFPIVNIYLIFPSFGKLSVKSAEDEAVVIAQHLSSIVVSQNNELRKPVDFRDAIKKVEKDFRLEKLKVFSEHGEIVYSTTPGDVGKRNDKNYFYEIVAKGNVYTNVVKKGTKTLEDRIARLDVVETYVPIMSDSKFIGAFEIYYDVTLRNQMLNKVIFRSSLISFSLMFIFFVILVTILLRSEKTTIDLHTEGLPASYRSPSSILLTFAVSIFVAEAVVMLFLSLFPPTSKLTEALLDSSLLIMLVSPMLYFFLFRPILEHITVRHQAEEELKKARDELENRVKKRTHELARVNERLRQDIAEREKLEEQLLHAQKMEAIGTLTGGIAHEFNNILTTIIGCGEFLQDSIKEDSTFKEHVEVILVSARRAANLTQGLLAYSRKQITQKNLLSLDEIVQKVEQLLSKIIGEDIDLRIVSRSHDIGIMADRNQVEQVLLNLATNARDAMPDGGTLTITLDLIELNDEFIEHHGYGEAGIYACISIEDTGIGMNEETKKKIFEPFFTTKDVGKGTGLGLSMVYGIVERHYGFIDVESEPGKGTRFRICLPALKVKVEGKEPIMTPLPSLGGTETILLAEDDDLLRKGIKSLFENSGYTIIEAVDGEDAIDKFNENKEKIDLLLCDLIMPKMNGKKVYDEIRKIRPSLKAIFISGYSEKIISEREILEEGLTIVSKPFSPKNLLTKVRQFLGPDLRDVREPG